MAKKGNGKALVTFEMLTEFYSEFLKPQFDELNEKIDKGFTEAKQEREEIKNELRYARDDIKGLEGELSDTVTRKEFESLRASV